MTSTTPCPHCGYGLALDSAVCGQCFAPIRPAPATADLQKGDLVYQRMDAKEPRMAMEVIGFEDDVVVTRYLSPLGHGVNAEYHLDSSIIGGAVPQWENGTEYLTPLSAFGHLVDPEQIAFSHRLWLAFQHGYQCGFYAGLEAEPSDLEADDDQPNA